MDACARQSVDSVDQSIIRTRIHGAAGPVAVHTHTYQPPPPPTHTHTCPSQAYIYAKENSYGAQDWQKCLTVPNIGNLHMDSNRFCTSASNFAGQAYLSILIAVMGLHVGLHDNDLLPFSAFTCVVSRRSQREYALDVYVCARQPCMSIWLKIQHMSLTRTGGRSGRAHLPRELPVSPRSALPLLDALDADAVHPAQHVRACVMEYVRAPRV